MAAIGATHLHGPHTDTPRVLIACAAAEAARLETLLAELDYAVCAAVRSGRQAIAMVESIPDGAPRPAVALIDPALAGEVPGVAAAAMRRRFGIPVIYVTDGDLPPHVADAARRAEPAGWVPRPVAPWHLRATIDAALSGQRREDELRQRMAAIQDRARETESELRSRVEAFRSRTALLNAAVNSIGEGLIAADRDGRYLLRNPAMERLIGMYEPDSELGERSRVYGLYYPDGKTLIPTDRLPLTRALRYGEATDLFDILVRNAKRPQGVMLSVSARPLHDADGALSGGVVVFRDITGLRTTERKLQETARRLEQRGREIRTVIGSISDGVVAADAAGNLTLFNPSAERILGMGKAEGPPEQRAERYGIHYLDEVTPVPADDLPLTRAVRGQPSDDEEYFVRNPGLREGVFVSVSGRPLRDGAGTPSGGVVVIRDVSERVRAHQTLLQAFAQGRLEVLDTVVHNIGNAINSVAIGVGTIGRELAGSPELRRFRALAQAVEQHAGDWPAYVQSDPQGRRVMPFLLALATDFEAQHQRLADTVERVRGRVAHIVDLVRTQKSFDSQGMTRKLVGLRRSIGAAVNVLAESCAARGIEVELDCSRAPREIWIQESRFHQMLVNLLKNAIEAIDALAADRAPDGGGDRPPHIRVACYLQDEFVVIDVIDNGIGIAKGRSRRIFTAGYSTKDGGTGLGLHSSANFVIGSGGSIQALSAGPGTGTTIRVRLRSAEKRTGN